MKKKILIVVILVVLTMVVFLLSGCNKQKDVYVVSIEKIETNENQDTYEIIYNDNTKSYFLITHGKDGIQGVKGKDGHSPVIDIGENGNWWIGTNDTGVKAEGKDGSAGEKGDTGEKGEKGDKGDKGDKGQNGSCAGWFYGTLWTKGDLYKENGAERPVGIKVYKEAESGGLVSTYMDEIYLKKGHTYSVTISASMELQSHEDRSGNYSVQMTDNYDDGFCREATRIKRDGVKLPYSRDQHHFSFSRIYIASDEDIPLRFRIEQSSYKTTLLGFNGTITITALD